MSYSYKLNVMKKIQMKALYFDGKRLEFRDDYPTPERKSGEALIRVRYAGICGTDLEILRGYAEFRGVLGHEFVGEVVEADDESLIGERVVGEINIGCGECEFCKKDLEKHCANRLALGIRGKDGAFAEYLTLPEKNLHRVPEEISDIEAVFTEPLAAAYEILTQLHLKPSWKALLLGDGRLGQLIAQVLKCHVDLIVVGRHPRKLKLLRELGINAIMVNELDRDLKFDLVIDATGNPDTILDAIKLAKPMGFLILKTTTSKRSRIPLSEIVVNEITIIGSRCGPFKPALKALKEKLVKVDYMIDGVYPIMNWKEAFEKAMKRETLKIILKIT